MAVLYVAFAAVALWLVSELLMQSRAQVHWRVLALLGFLCVVLGVAAHQALVIVVGIVLFAVGQTFVTLAVRRGDVRAWVAIDREARSPRGLGEQPGRLHVDPVEEVSSAPSAYPPYEVEQQEHTAAMPAVTAESGMPPPASAEADFGYQDGSASVGYAAAYPGQAAYPADGTTDYPRSYPDYSAVPGYGAEQEQYGAGAYAGAEYQTTSTFDPRGYVPGAADAGQGGYMPAGYPGDPQPQPPYLDGQFDGGGYAQPYGPGTGGYGYPGAELPRQAGPDIGYGYPPQAEPVDTLGGYGYPGPAAVPHQGDPGDGYGYARDAGYVPDVSYGYPHDTSYGDTSYGGEQSFGYGQPYGADPASGMTPYATEPSVSGAPNAPYYDPYAPDAYGQQRDDGYGY